MPAPGAVRKYEICTRQNSKQPNKEEQDNDQLRATLFATRVFRARTILTLVVVAVLATVAAPLASAQTFLFNRADFATGTGPAY